MCNFLTIYSNLFKANDGSLLALNKISFLLLSGPTQPKNNNLRNLYGLKHQETQQPTGRFGTR